MPKKTQQVYQFKITLEEIKPTIWRRIQVPEKYTFWDLHVAIQDAMGWQDYHFHEFEIINPHTGRKEEIGIPDEGGELGFLTGWEIPILAYFSLENKQARYLYDFGDSWEHRILLEKILPREAGLRYPFCVAGERACPPEDCGGTWGYEHLLEVIKDRKHQEYRSITEWLGGRFDPEAFDPKGVHFDNPRKRWDIAFRESYGV